VKHSDQFLYSLVPLVFHQMEIIWLLLHFGTPSATIGKEKDVAGRNNPAKQINIFRMKFTVNEIAMAIGLLFPAVIMVIWLFLVRSEVQEAEAKKKIE
jgi:hypothetical protein